jgi:hypothetical protein
MKAQNLTTNYAIGDLVSLWHGTNSFTEGWKITEINTNGTYSLEHSWEDTIFYTPVKNVPNGCISRAGSRPSGNPPSH